MSESAPSRYQEVWIRLRVIILAGIPAGVLVAGLGSRLAMLVLRLTSPDSVRGVTSDDGFEIGRFTVGGTYNLLMLGAVVGLIGAVAYRTVRRWLIGPHWFQRFTVAAASGAVVGSMLVHDDGIDFHALEPTWLAIGLFVALPAVFGWSIAVAVDLVEARPARTDRRSFVLPAVALVAFPPALFVGAVVAVGVVVRVAIGRQVARGGPVVVSTGWANLIRAGWLTIAMWGLVVLIRDVRAITA